MGGHLAHLWTDKSAKDGRGKNLKKMENKNVDYLAKTDSHYDTLGEMG